jgi:hypothetical protein
MFGELSVLRVEVVSGCTLVCTIRLSRFPFALSASGRNA